MTDPRERADSLKKLIREWGADLVGIADISAEEAKMALPAELMNFSRAISIAIHCRSHDSLRSKSPNEDLSELMIRYIESNQDVVASLNLILKKLCKQLKSYGSRCFALPPIHTADDRRFVTVLYPMFPHRTAATLSGLGWIGKNGMLINGEYGPNLVWATVLTNADIVPGEPQEQSLCFGCRLCQEVCPAGAILGINWSRSRGNAAVLDVTACAGQMEKNAERYGRPVCGVCFMACPMGSRHTRGGR